ncbi:MAG: hypothetical protein NVSMB29_04360 [Candidatus Dormibacteria bacterium]
MPRAVILVNSDGAEALATSTHVSPGPVDGATRVSLTARSSGVSPQIPSGTGAQSHPGATGSKGAFRGQVYTVRIKALSANTL